MKTIFYHLWKFGSFGKDLWKQHFHTFLGTYINQEQNNMQKGQVSTALSHIFESYNIQEQIVLQKEKYQ